MLKSEMSERAVRKMDFWWIADDVHMTNMFPLGKLWNANAADCAFVICIKNKS